jgi:hypothetical protein
LDFSCKKDYVIANVEFVIILIHFFLTRSTADPDTDSWSIDVALVEVSKAYFAEVTGSLIPSPTILVGFSIICVSISVRGQPVNAGRNSSNRVC